MWGLGVLGWGFGTRGGVRFVEWTSHGGPALPTALDAHVFERRTECVAVGTRRLLLALVTRLCWRVSRWCEAVDEAVLDRVLARFLRVERYFLVVLVVGLL